jgi:hypothetical protein
MSGENSVSSAEGETLSSGHEVEPTSHTAVSQVHTQVLSPTGADQHRSTSHSPKSHQSRRPRTDRVHTVSVPVAQLSAKDRFRSAVRKVIAVHRTATLRRRPGAEPGVDPHRHSTYAAYGHIRQKCVIDVIDYSSLRCSFGRMSNTGFIQFLQNNQASAREPWVKVRWINIGGISWDVISALAIKYGNSWSHRQSSRFSIPDPLFQKTCIRYLLRTCSTGVATHFQRPTTIPIISSYGSYVIPLILLPAYLKIRPRHLP